ncbi:Pre-mRNA-splicing factor cwf19 [Grifola frondosa]|uniref:Pre-mRNA-splicing factor cwf19 n=1 Tax=Grifola frondosa TaxID=5627 RepID=A0A1C7M107_GRIFR|nr:Pre-mRNA-splicing factor cwf19 [Grifola frondosa]
MGDETKKSSKHRHANHEHKSKRRHKSDEEGSRKRHRKDDNAHFHIVDDDPFDDEVWIEKNIDMGGEEPVTTTIPTAEDLKITSRAASEESDPPLPPTFTTETVLKRDDWMLMPSEAPSEAVAPSSSRLRVPTGDESMTEEYGEPSQNARTTSGGVDFFSNLGTEIRKKKPQPDRPDPDKLFISHKELNTALKEGKSIDEQPAPAPKAVVPGGPGSQWRMMKLRRVYETAEEEGKSAEEVALDRFGSLEAFEEAKEERRILDEREERRASWGGERKGRPRGKGKEPEGERRYMFTDIGGSGASSRSSSFRRPDLGGSIPSTPPPADAEMRSKRFDTLRLSSQGGTPRGQVHTPIPSVLTPSTLPGSKTRALSPSSLNKLQAKVLRANAKGAWRWRGEEGVRTRVEVLPTLDARGRLYDVGLGKDEPALPPGNRKKKEIVETRDPKTGELIRYNADDDTITLGEMLREEKFGAGMADQKNLDAEFARAIMADGKFENDLEYIDDNAEMLGRKKMRSDAIKRQFAINDYKRTQKVLASCPFCFGEDDSLPKAPIIAMGTRVYLSCTLNEELVDGHCLIVPIQHHLTMLEGDDDVWDEIRNFMKCLMRMFAEEDKGVVFYETVLSLKGQKHTFIECVPLPWGGFEVIPGYFKESILIEARGFRRAMVPNLPYFMVQFDYKGEKGYGHVIEGIEAAGTGEDPEGDIDEGEKGGGEFPRWFAGEIIGNLLDLEPRRWRRARRIDFHQNKDRVARFKKKQRYLQPAQTLVPICPYLLGAHAGEVARNRVRCIIYDLEDSVPPSPKDKNGARERLRHFLSTKPASDLPHPERIAVRLNQSELPTSRMISPKPCAYLRSEHSCSRNRGVRSRDNVPLQLVASIESAQSLYNIGEIARWTSEYGPAMGGKLAALLFAAEDYCADTSIIRTTSRKELLYTRSQIVVAAKAFGLDAIDMVCVNYKDLNYLKDECEDGRHLGFNGKQAIHPTQVEVIQTTFVPSEQEILRAAKILHQMEVAHLAEKGAIGLELVGGGKEMIDAPMLKQAENTIRNAKLAGLEIPRVD